MLQIAGRLALGRTTGRLLHVLRIAGPATVHTNRKTGYTARAYSIPVDREKDWVNIVEVGPRDGLQNEKGGIVPVETKVALIDRLVAAGVRTVEAGSFVSPKWVPQMAGTDKVLRHIATSPGVHYPVLVPNERGLTDLLALLHAHPRPSGQPPLTDEIAVFIAATDSFSRANLNCSVAESLARIAPVVRKAREHGLRVRGYVSVVVWCPFEGRVDAERVREVSRELYDMGCYEVSLGETVGQARPHEVHAMLEEVARSVEVGKLAGHFHDTYGMGVANVLTALDFGVRTIDAAVGGLGGCPYSPGATGNVATEDVLYALQDSKYSVVGNINLQKMSEIGWWICAQLKRAPDSRVARALRARSKL